MHQNLYPLMQAQDYVKLAYQSAFGCGHMVSSYEACLARLLDERKCETGFADREYIGGGYFRLYLKGDGFPLSTETIARMFYESAREVTEEDKAEFFHSLDALCALAKEKKIAPTEDEIASAIQKFKDGDFSPVSHSDVYRNAYHPSYRVISMDFYRILPHISELEKAASYNVYGLVVAIDGMCASGKTTLGNLLSKALGANLVHMDDFFLPPEKRTKERLSTPGGNIDSERFLEEVLIPLRNLSTFYYRPFDCSTMSLSPDVVFVDSCYISIVEGSYSCHPDLIGYYNKTFFVKTDEKTQIERIRKRNGEKMLKRFIDEWIPMENMYFEAFSIEDKASYTIYT